MNEENKKIKNNIKSTFDNVAKSYDTNKQFEISAKKMVELIDVDNPLNILDISTGTGSIAIGLAKKFPSANIHAVDISGEMLNIAKAKTKEQGLLNITYHLQDVENLDFEGIEFDIITCGYGLFFYPDMDGVFCDVCSRLTSDGRFVFSTFTDNAFQPYSKIFLDMLDQNYDIRPPERIEKRQLVTKDEIEELTSQVKHNGLKIHDADIRFPMDIHAWWSLLNTTGYSGLLSQLEENYKKFEKEYIEHLKSLHEDNNIKFNADSLISIVKI